MGEWTVTEYDPSSGRRIAQWIFPSFKDAEEFRHNRKEFYGTIGFEKRRAFTPALPKISHEEMELFEKIIQSPELMSRIMRRLIPDKA